jgi:hypothetical protein
MAYNPFDDVIENDPAYMSNGGGLPRPKIGIEFPNAPQTFEPQRSVIPQRRVIASDQEIFRPVSTAIARAYKLLTPEQETLDQIEKDQQLRSLATAQAFKGTEFEEYAGEFDLPSAIIQNSKASELLKNVGYQPEGFVEGMSRVGQFFYGNQRKAFEKLRDGEELTSEDRISIALAPLDSLDFIFPPLVIKKLANIGLKNVNQVLKSTADLPEVRQVKEFFGGAPVPAIGRAEGPPGMNLEPRVNLAPDRDGVGGGSATTFNAAPEIKKPNYEIQSGKGKGQGLVTKQQKIDEKVVDIIKENPDGVALQLGRKNLEKNYNIDRHAYKKSIARLEEANPNINFDIHKLETTKRADVIKETQRKKDFETIQKIKAARSLKQAALLTKKSVKAIRGLVQRSGDDQLAKQLGIGAKAEEMAERRKILEDFLETNSNKQFTRPELARATKIPLQFVKDKSLFQTKKSNLVEYKDLKAKEFDERISEMNRLLDDIEAGINSETGKALQSRMGPKYYADQGYDAFTPGQLKNHPSYLAFPKQGEKLKLKVEPENLSNIIGQRNRPPGEVIDHISNYINLDVGSSSSLRNKAKLALREYYRSLSDANRAELTKILSDPELFGFVPKSILDEAGNVVPNKDWDQLTQKRNLDNLYNTILSLQDPADVMKLGQAQDLKRAINSYADEKFFNALDGSPALQKQLIDEVNRIKPDNKYGNDWRKAYKDYKNRFHGQISHEFSQRMLGTPKNRFSLAPGMEGKFGDPASFRINFDNHNVALQPVIENGTKQTVAKMNKAKNVGDQLVELRKILENDAELRKRGMMAYIRFSDKQMSDASFNFLKRNLPSSNQIFKTSKGFGKTPEGIKTMILGDPKKPDFDTLKSYLDESIDKMVANPKSFKLDKRKSTGADQDDMIEAGDAKSIRYGYINKETFKDGGPVKMAIGGDPLTNLNQQQFSPDPAFEGQDFFQEAVDSGNLQAVNLLNLFKVFQKPKVMATPSNVKQVEQARDPMPQGVPGSQQVQPLPAGKPDFFFKSFLLDQLNLPNAPKASTPQGWREFLIKGKKVPEAEMLDTGILQYLEDTEKFYPNKKITKQELEDLYDTSPLGNLEVRVKETLTPQTTRDGEFLADQGRPKHRNAGNVRIDEQADDYFEVVVNVPTLPGQERAFVNSSHFEEPNVLGFTRVGTYKNSNNETVAVIQEMQTDMLTEVRKEQERLFAMINALKRRRAQLVDQAQGVMNPEYYKNELRLFDQKYPPAKLDALETDNLIQPFPNVVAKDLIPERTASLNSIQEQINKLIMANVEQYNDPAYKTMVFDLAQQQNKIFEDLNSMNRSANYEESLRDFKVPSTTDRDELNRIAYSDDYLPSDYQTRQVTSFPPIPFNKQADYVDLLIKSTIKAAKGKGIDKVAIMPANVGANPRWGKSSDEAKKKFENLYDKVGVQQLKNIAKKYGGKLEIEKIVDPSKATRGLTFLNKNPDGEFQILKQTETKKEISDADRDKYYDEEITRIASGITDPGEVVLTREISPGQMMDYHVVEGRGDATDVGYRLIPYKQGENVDDAMIKIVEYNPSEIDMYTISFDPSQLEEPMYLFKKKSGGSIDKDSLVSITDIYGEYGR